MECKSEITLINGDAIDPKNYQNFPAIHTVILDPPFYVKKSKFHQIRKKNKTQLDAIHIPEDWETFWNLLCKNAKDHIAPDGWFIYKADIHTLLISMPITSKYFDFIGDTVWDKIRIGTGYYIRKQHEYILIFRPKKAQNSYTLQRPRKNGLKSVSHGNSKGKAFRSIIRILNSNGGEFGQKSKKHINQTEIELWKRFLLYFVPSGKIILDPCMGSGSIGKAAKMLGLGYVGIEYETKFYEIAKKEIQSIQRSEKITQFFK